MRENRGGVSAEYVLLAGLVALGSVFGLLHFGEGSVQGALSTSVRRLACYVAGADGCGGAPAASRASASSPFSPFAPPWEGAKPKDVRRVEGPLQSEHSSLEPATGDLGDPSAFAGMDREQIRTALIESGLSTTQAALRAGAIYRANHPQQDGVRVADASSAWARAALDALQRGEPEPRAPTPGTVPGNSNRPSIRVVPTANTPPVQVVRPPPSLFGGLLKRGGGNLLAALVTGIGVVAAEHYLLPEVAQLPEVQGDFGDYQLDAEGRWLVDLDGHPVRWLSEHRLPGFSWGRHLVMNNDHGLVYLHNNWTFRSHPVPEEAMQPGASAEHLIAAALAQRADPEGWNTLWQATELFDPAAHESAPPRRFVWTERGGATFEWDAEAQQWVQTGGVALLPEELLRAANSLAAATPGALAPGLDVTTMSVGGGDGPAPEAGPNGEHEEDDPPLIEWVDDGSVRVLMATYSDGREQILGWRDPRGRDQRHYPPGFEVPSTPNGTVPLQVDRSIYFVPKDGETAFRLGVAFRHTPAEAVVQAHQVAAWREQRSPDGNAGPLHELAMEPITSPDGTVTGLRNVNGEAVPLRAEEQELFARTADALHAGAPPSIELVNDILDAIENNKLGVPHQTDLAKAWAVLLRALPSGSPITKDRILAGADLPAVLLVVHQSPTQSHTGEALERALEGELGQLPMVALSATEFAPFSQGVVDDADVLEYSARGRIQFPLNTGELHLAGGYCNFGWCLQEATRQIANTAFDEFQRGSITLVVHSSLVYERTDSGSVPLVYGDPPGQRYQSLARILAPHGFDITRLDVENGTVIMHNEDGDEIVLEFR